MLDKVRETIKEYGMLPDGATVFVGLSGGADSVCCLLVLKELSEELGITLKAVHVNHCLRGAESDADEAFCIKLCNELGISLSIRRAAVRDLARRKGLSIEEAAREARYEIFSDKFKNSHKPDSAIRIATAHTLNDSAETVLINLARGSGLKGLSGIPPVRGNIIRPLIKITRREIIEYLNGRPYVTDATNLSADYTRNRIRLEVMPVFEEINGGFLKGVSSMAGILDSENSFIEEEAEKARGKDLRKIHQVLRRRIIKNFLGENSVPISHKMVYMLESAVLLEKTEKINLKGNLYAFAGYGELRAETLLNSENPQRFSYEEKVIFDFEMPFGDKTVIISKKKCENINAKENIHKFSTKDLLDYDKIQGSVILRNKRGGDKYKISGKNFTSSLKKLLPQKYAFEEREKIAVLSDNLGIIWVEGFGPAERAKADSDSERIITIRIMSNDGRN